MRKVASLILLVVMVFSLSACGSSEPKVEVTAESSLTSLQEKISNVISIVVYDEETDPNENLGRPGQYIGKADFFDDRMEDTEDNAGTIEFFSSKSDCNDRYEYLCKLSDPELGVFGVNQYIYKYDLAVFRVSFDLTPTQAEEYKAAMDEIMGEVSEQYKG
ncbi:lipoprotein [Candidatus Allofournierella merdipullorum]|uniref:LptM family lipoprotein n=1 Tax=Candidatus Allofournierella merdipullorum TaxID=2838595 RepID=UPI003AB575F5